MAKTGPLTAEEWAEVERRLSDAESTYRLWLEGKEPQAEYDKYKATTNEAPPLDYYFWMERACGLEVGRQACLIEYDEYKAEAGDSALSFEDWNEQEYQKSLSGYAEYKAAGGGLSYLDWIGEEAAR